MSDKDKVLRKLGKPKKRTIKASKIDWELYLTDLARMQGAKRRIISR